MYKKLITPAGEVEIKSKVLEDFLINVPKRSGYISRKSRYVENGYEHHWFFDDGKLKTTIKKKNKIKYDISW